MAKKNILPAKDYARLLSSIQKDIAHSAEHIKELFRRETIKSYWDTGRRITRFLAQKSRAKRYGARLYQMLSQDLQIDSHTLYDCVKFYEVYPLPDLTQPLSWSHYRKLAHLDAEDRRQWEKRIIKEGMLVKDFIALLGQARQTSLVPVKGKLQPARGLLYHYRLLKFADALEKDSRLMIDAGFDNYKEPPPAAGVLSNARIYCSEKIKDRYGLVATNVTKAQIYTYKANIIRIIDADTLVVMVDCGFGDYHRETLRLRGIDAPELSTTAGRLAKQWVEEQLKESSWVVIRTHKTDKYDRYLVDVFYEANEADPQAVADSGMYLNQQLLEAGHAVIWK